MTRGKAGPTIRPGISQAVGTGVCRRACWGTKSCRHAGGSQELGAGGARRALGARACVNPHMFKYQLSSN